MAGLNGVDRNTTPSTQPDFITEAPRESLWRRVCDVVFSCLSCCDPGYGHMPDTEVYHLLTKIEESKAADNHDTLFTQIPTNPH